MRLLAGFDRLFRRGILGINRRNVQCILERNPRAVFPVVDDKLLMTQLCERVNIPTPTVLGVIERHKQLHALEPALRYRDKIVIKPARGSGGRGIMILAGKEGDSYFKANGQRIDFDGIRQHSADILSGMFSIGGQPDRVILQERVGLHPAFAGISPRGIPDVRLVLYRFELAMAMLRLPTLESNGRANLHQGGIGVGIDVQSGRARSALYHHRYVQHHPDTGEALVNRLIPHWGEIVELSRKAARAIGLGFVGIDMVIDDKGPMLLEANARPGLAIQIVNNQGLLERIDEIDQAARR